MIPISQNKRKTRKRAIKLAKKLCHCIKAIGGPLAYPICQCSVVHRRGLRVHKFTCKGKPRILQLSKLKKEEPGVCPHLTKLNNTIKK